MQADDVIWFVAMLCAVSARVLADTPLFLTDRDIINRQHCSFKLK